MHAVQRWLLRWAERIAVGSVVCIVLVLAMCEARAQDIQTDANLVTGIDVSASISEGELRLQLDGISAALQSPEIQGAIRRGRHGRIGVLIFLWADQGCPLVADWRIIAGPDDAAALARDLSVIPPGSIPIAGLTDLSAAMDCGRAFLATAPFRADRSVLNIATNGTDNANGGMAEARAAAIDARIGVNAVALPGGDPLVTLEPWLRANVLIGPMAFVVAVSRSDGFAQAYRRKFIGDIAMAQ